MMNLPNLTCTFTRHRSAKLPWRYNENDPRCAELKQRLFDTVEAVYSAGFTHFICGMAEGSDLYFCEAVMALRGEHPEITIEAAVPFEGQSDKWPRAQRERYQRLICECDSVVLIQKEYSPGCMMKRNKYMVDNAQLIIACYDGKTGGTLNTLRYALEKGVQVLHLPLE